MYMNVIKKLLFTLFVWQAVALPFFIAPKSVSAQPSCTGFLSIDLNDFPENNTFVHQQPVTPTPSVEIGGLSPNTQYIFETWHLGWGAWPDTEIHSGQIGTNGSGIARISFSEVWWDPPSGDDWSDLTGYLKIIDVSTRQDICKAFDYHILRDNTLDSCTIEIGQRVNGQLCWGCFVAGAANEITVTLKDRANNPYRGSVYIDIGAGEPSRTWFPFTHSGVITIHDKVLQAGEKFELYVKEGPVGAVVCSRESPVATATCDPTLACSNPIPVDPSQTIPYELCNQIKDPTAFQECKTCSERGGGNVRDPGGIWTAIGCIDRNPESIIVTLITIGIGMGGGVALLMILIAGFMLTTSQGDPKRTGEAKEMVTAAVIGLVFVIFSVTILQFIGVTVLRIPGFGG